MTFSNSRLRGRRRRRSFKPLVLWVHRLEFESLHYGRVKLMLSLGCPKVRTMRFVLLLGVAATRGRESGRGVENGRWSSSLMASHEALW